MSDFRANEIFSVGAFIMLGIGGAWQEKLTRKKSPYREIGARAAQAILVAQPLMTVFSEDTAGSGGATRQGVYHFETTAA